MNRHLCRAVNYSVRDGRFYKLKASPVLNDKCVSSDRSGEFHKIGEIRCFVVGNNCIYSDVQLCTVLMAELCSFFQFLVFETGSLTVAGRETLSADINSICSGAQSGSESVHTSGWSEDLFGGLTAEPTVFTGYDTLNDNSVVVALMLIVYGVAFILIERRPRVPTTTKLSRITYPQAFKVGCWQVLSLIPGTSRSGSTILGGMLCGMSRPAASQFTFFLAIPVMAGASLLKLVKFFGKGNSFTLDQTVVLIVGCAVAFIVSIIAIRFLMDYVKRHDFKFFGAYRIVLGIIVLAVAAATAIF